jgi:multiple sugar transport system substrate-binding protein
MIEIEFSLMGTEDEIQRLRPWMDEFEKKQRVRVKLVALEWVGGWAKIVNMALYGRGPDISEIGSTWTASLASMNTLTPFSPMVLNGLGGKQAFLESSMESCILPDHPQVWAIPWLADVHVLYYQRNALEKAGIPANFGSPEDIERTLAGLQQVGHQHPLALIVSQEPNMIHAAASWVWREEGHFLETNGHKVSFDQEKALRGFVKYFSLRRFMAAGYSENQDSWNKFVNGERLIATATPAHYMQAREANPGMVKSWGAAPVAGASFVGGTNLVVWKHSRQSSAALDLVDFLTEKATGFPASPHAFRAPCRISALDLLQQSEDAIVKSIVEAVKTGRNYKINPLWSLVEKGLIAELANIWRILLDNPARDVDTTVRESLTALARRLNVSMTG